MRRVEVPALQYVVGVETLKPAFERIHDLAHLWLLVADLLELYADKEAAGRAPLRCMEGVANWPLPGFQACRSGGGDDRAADAGSSSG